MAQQLCRCEATVASSILEGFTCGNPDCWRTAPAQAAFDTFVAELVAKRGDEARPGDQPVREG